MDILSTSSGRTQGVRTKSLQKADILANFEQQMAEWMKAAGQRIQVAREAKWKTRAKAYEETGIQEKQWYRWEHGLVEPTANNWDRLEEALGVPASELRADPPKLLDPESELHAQLDRIEEKLDEALRRLSSLGGEEDAPPDAPPVPSRKPKPPPPLPSPRDKRAPRKRRAGSG